MPRSASLMATLAGCLLALAAAEAGAEVNRLANGDFDVGAGVTGWLVEDPGVSAFDWVAADADDCGQSGAGRLSNTAPTGYSWALVRACAPAEPGESFQLALQVRFLAGTATSVFVAEVAFWDGTDCTGTELWAGFGLSLSSEVTSWTPLVWPDLPAAPDGTQSVAVDLNLAKEPAGSLAQLELDRVLLTAPGGIFADGFEGGETCRWDLVVP